MPISAFSIRVLTKMTRANNVLISERQTWGVYKSGPDLIRCIEILADVSLK